MESKFECHVKKYWTVFLKSRKMGFMTEGLKIIEFYLSFFCLYRNSPLFIKKKENQLILLKFRFFRGEKKNYNFNWPF